ncbi:hypothetical protein GCM10009425_10120 [Pseudomonas asuensis]|uniref:DUF1826 domain-containing protein n=2 Tax=Pseudomonas asuensis TaxID=1825787 RepID=A0ABQ2GLD2_9PSED|nr:hypothetical protein GCM10009425_10120 [Pseudomonas asuensis]
MQAARYLDVVFMDGSRILGANQQERLMNVAELTEITRQVEGDTPAVLADVLHDRTNLAIWNRSLPLHIDHFARMLAGVAEPFAQSLVIHLENAEAEPNVSELASAYRDIEGHEGFIADIAWLVKAFAFLLDARRVGVRLRLLDKAMCPRFHVDHVPLRLVTTYAGPGSLWSSKSQLISSSPDDAHQLSPGAVALLKGDKWEGNEGAGIVHCSPALKPGEKRLFLSLDWLA